MFRGNYPRKTSPELNKAICGAADEAIKLYDSQFVKFNKVLSGWHPKWYRGGVDGNIC